MTRNEATSPKVPTISSRVLTDANWRSIRCVDVEWNSIPGFRNRASRPLYCLCRVPDDIWKGEWHALTLGDVADMGVRAWSRIENVGPVTIELIKLTIDYAAAGRDIQSRKDAYVPRPLKDAP